MKNQLDKIVVCICVLLLAACGGGSSNSQPAAVGSSTMNSSVVSSSVVSASASSTSSLSPSASSLSSRVSSASASAAQIVDLKSNLSAATDFVFDSSRDYIYFTQKSGRSLGVLDARTGQIVKTISFAKMPESLFLSQDKSKLYVALLDTEHDPYFFEAQTGAVGIIDLATLTLTKTLVLNTDPFDLVVTQKGKLVVTSGSAQWTNIYAYDVLTGAELGRASIRQMSHITLHPSEDWVFTTDTDLSPSDMNKYDIRGIGIVAAGESPYHGDHRINGDAWATPDGKYLITKGGDVFLAGDMSYVSSLTAATLGIKQFSADALGSVALLTLTNDTVMAVNLASLEPIKTFTVFGAVNFAALTQTTTYILATSAGISSIIAQAPPCNCANNKAPKAQFSFTPSSPDTTKTIRFDASGSLDPDGDSLSYRWDTNSDGIWDTTFSTSATYEKRFAVAGVKYVRLQVKDASGAVSTQTQVVDIAQGADAGTAVLGATANLLAFNVGDVVTDTLNSKFYIADKTAQRLYVVDIVTGVTEKYFSFEGIPDSLSLSPDGSTLVVALLKKAANAYAWDEEKLSYLAVINTQTQSSINTIALNSGIVSIATLNNNKVVVASSASQTNLQIYDLSTGQALGNSIYAYTTGRLAVNATGTTLFLADSYINKYDVSGVTPVAINQSNYSTGYRAGNRVWVTPDGKYLITQGGDIITAADYKFVIAKTSANISIANVSFDSVSNIAILTLSDGTIDVINLASLESVKKFSGLGTVNNVSIASNNLYMVSSLAGVASIVKLEHPCVDCASNKPPLAAISYSPVSAGNTSSTYQFNAAGSSDPENNSLTYRWDLDGDSVWDSGFSASSTAMHKYLIAGTKTIRLQVKDSKGAIASATATVVVAQGVDNGVPIVDGTANQFSFKHTQSVADAVRGKLYVTDKAAKRLYIVDLATGLAEKYFQFEFLPESMVLSADGAKLYVALLAKEHNLFVSSEPRSGYIAVIDLVAGAHVNSLVIDSDPYQLAMSADNYLVVFGTGMADGQWTGATFYDTTSGQHLSHFGLYIEEDPLAFDSLMDVVYFADGGSLKKADLRNSTASNLNLSYTTSGGELGTRLWLTPDRKFIIAQSGNVFNASDLSLVKRLTDTGVSIQSVSFDAQANLAFLGLSSGYLQTLNLTSQELITKTNLAGVASASVMFNSGLYVLNSAANNLSLIKQEHPCPSCATNKAPSANFALISSAGNTADTYQFNASASSDPESSTLAYRWDINGDNQWDTEWLSSALYSYKFLLPGNKTVRVQVKDLQGAVNSYSQTFSVAQGVELGTAVTDSTAFSLNFAASDVVTDTKNGKLYISDKAARRIYVVDLATGLTQKYIDMPYGPEQLAISLDGNFIYVSLPTAAHSYYQSQSGYIGVIDTAQQAYIKTFPIAIDPYDLVVTQDNRLVVSSGSGQWTTINSYNAATGEPLGNATIYQNAVLAVHPSNTWVFAMDTALSPTDIHKFDAQSTNLLSLGDSPYHGDHRLYGPLWVTPDGKYIITGGGDIVQAADLTYVKGLTAPSVSIKALTFDSLNKQLIIVNSNLELVSYDLATLTQKSVIATNVAEPKIIYVFDGSLYLMHSNLAGQALDKIAMP